MVRNTKTIPILLILVIGWPIPCLAGDETEALKDQARRAAFEAAATNDDDDFKNIERAAIIDAVNHAFLTNRNLTEDQLIKLYNNAQDKVNQRLRDSQGNYRIPQGAQTGFDFFNSVLNVVKEVEGLGLGAAAVQEGLNQGVRLYELKNAEQARIEAQKSRFSDYISFRNWQGLAISQALALAEYEPEFSRAFNVRFAPEFNATTLDSFGCRFC